MGVNIVKYGNQTLIDLTDTTAVASDVAQGKYFYGKDGVKTEGTATGGAQITVEPLSVSQNGTYTAPANTAYSPVTVNVAGETYLMGPNTGVYYKTKIEQTLTSWNNNNARGRWGSCDYLEELIIHGMTSHNNIVGYIAYRCPVLTKLLLPDLSGSSNSYITGICPSLTEIQVGSIGHAMTGLYGNAFSGATSADLVLTIYVGDNTTIPLSNSPFGATNATIVYRSSTTGEVRTV